MMGLRAIAEVLLALSIAFGAADQAPALKVISEATYESAETRVFVVHSQSVGRDFLITVAIPPAPGSWVGAPGNTAQPQKFPAIYALDNGYAIAGPLGQMMTGTAISPPAYVVSIGYPKGAPDMRNTDMLFQPTVDGGTDYGGGGGARFQAFLVEELRPFLEAKFPLDPSKAVLFGHSFGGMFAAEVLARAPTSFGAFVLASPSTWADPQLIPQLRLAAGRGAGRRVLVAVGEKESERALSGAEAVAAALRGEGSTFRAEMRVFAGEGHISYYPALASAALALLSAPPPRRTAAIEASRLEPLVGEYQLADGRVVTITRREAKLYLALTGMPGAAELSAEGPRAFFLAGADLTLTFEGSDGTAPAALEWRFAGTSSRAVRK